MTPQNAGPSTSGLLSQRQLHMRTGSVPQADTPAQQGYKHSTSHRHDISTNQAAALQQQRVSLVLTAWVPGGNRLHVRELNSLGLQVHNSAYSRRCANSTLLYIPPQSLKGAGQGPPGVPKGRCPTKVLSALGTLLSSPFSLLPLSFSSLPPTHLSYLTPEWASLFSFFLSWGHGGEPPGVLARPGIRGASGWRLEEREHETLALDPYPHTLSLLLAAQMTPEGRPEGHASPRACWCVRPVCGCELLDALWLSLCLFFFLFLFLLSFFFSFCFF